MNVVETPKGFRILTQTGRKMGPTFKSKIAAINFFKTIPIQPKKKQHLPIEGQNQ